MEIMIERRKNPRYKINNNPFVVHLNSIGKIENLSMDGMCCTCMDDADSDSCMYKKIDILCSKENFFLQNLGITVIKTKVEDRGKTIPLFMRECHLQFNSLTDEDNHRLSCFIMNNTSSDRKHLMGTSVQTM